MIFQRTIAALVLALGALAVAVAPASAHTELKSSDPAPNTSVSAETFQAITLTFSEPVTQPEVMVAGQDGVWTLGTPSIAGAVVTIPVTTSGPTGAYTVTWKVTSADGDPVKGTIPFTFVAPVASTTSEPPATSASGNVSVPAPAPSGGIPGWVWIALGGLVAVAVAGFVVSRRGRA
ncbi:hypothetical protein Lesp02_32510 [Lentzea sp. NBRC 105346]|uniref:copper resistance CopC family protein n=1 Tax=Lentzea sp. NBRC 105346 TaxID=3032205 RepID=UPI0024A4CC30|nr:copper resistance CopC family protein [Lentzea sp. NBRC 105346]GLZ31062.1 hypothetical protein Lesp02_32510 [Lentzea sp. NBRC 105346]